ncbi:MAG: 6-phosphogluconolactonase [Crocinitomicaceae bacterium]
MKHFFNSKEALNDGFVLWCSQQIENAVRAHGSANVLLSGGGTPGPAYAKMNAEFSFLSDLHLGLVDERFVSQDSEFSNERLIRHCFSNVAEQNISGMVYDIEDAERNLKILTNKYNRYIQRTDLIILGMGPDGHTASIFPDDSASESALEATTPFLNTNAPTHPTNRITCSLDFIRKAKNCALLITGTQKLEVLKNTSLQLPIHKVLDVCPNIQLFYSE